MAYHDTRLQGCTDLPGEMPKSEMVCRTQYALRPGHMKTMQCIACGKLEVGYYTHLLSWEVLIANLKAV